MTLVFRSKAAWVLGWAWMVFAAWNTWDLIAHGRMPSALIAGAVPGVITALVFLLALRPAIVAREDGVLVRNPLRNAYVPWSSVDEVRVSNAITIGSGDMTIHCWTPQPSARERARAVRRAGKMATEPTMSKADRMAAEAVAGRTHADWVTQQLTELATSRKATSSGEAAVTWSLTAIAALALTVAMVAITIALAK